MGDGIGAVQMHIDPKFTGQGSEQLSRLFCLPSSPSVLT